MNNRGRAAGALIAVLLLAALLAAFLFTKRIGGAEKTEQAPAVAAQEAAERINEAQNKALEALESFG